MLPKATVLSFIYYCCFLLSLCAFSFYLLETGERNIIIMPWPLKAWLLVDDGFYQRRSAKRLRTSRPSWHAPFHGHKPDVSQFELWTVAGTLLA